MSPDRSAAFAVLVPVHSSTHVRSDRLARRARGFTLLEILLAIAIIALVGTVLIGGSSRLLSDKPVTPHEIFWKAVQEARKTALKSEHEVRLRFDRDRKQFVILDGLAPATLAADGVTSEEKPLKQFPIPSVVGTDFAVDFLGPSAKGASAILVGGVLIESRPLKHVTFYADGTCSPFRAQFVRNGGTSMLTIDPWTCAPILTPADPNAPPAS
jgi:prepilin-type N-terminal cleavage/methylation domain-containing protein